jgi:uncharacterized membrane protein YdbT with pleckstrin-like domain
MSYIERHLTPGETVVFRTRLHWVVFGGTIFFAACVIGIVVLIVARNDLPPETVRLLWLAGVVIAVGSFVTPVLRWRNAEFAVTTTRLIVTAGLFSPRAFEFPLAKVELAADPGIVGSQLGYGTLRILRPDGTVDEFARVAHPEALRGAVTRHSVRSPTARAR